MRGRGEDLGRAARPGGMGPGQHPLWPVNAVRPDRARKGKVRGHQKYDLSTAAERCEISCDFKPVPGAKMPIDEAAVRRRCLEKRTHIGMAGRVSHHPELRQTVLVETEETLRRYCQAAAQGIRRAYEHR